MSNITANEYQKLAERTINKELVNYSKVRHALHGMVGEIGELHSLYQKQYQGHKFDDEHAKKELGDLCWFICEYCTASGWEFSEILEMNIEKLQARYKDGFSEEESLHRKDGDI